MLEQLSLADFVPYLNLNFLIQVDESEIVTAELVEATALGLPDSNQPEARAPFSLVFRTSQETCLSQRIYEISRDDLGILKLFLVPIGPDSVGMCYQAVFA